jgi:pSer/pThr/pTyr-binding forkhead associated (FHA) protein
MDHSRTSAEADGLSVPGPHWRTRSIIPVPDDFFPLRLILQPSGATIELTQPDMLIGRHSQADVRLPLPDVSRRHCRFFFSEGIWQVLDLNSLNGVFLNEQPIRQAALRQGDLLRIGGFVFAVDLCGAQPPADASEKLIRGIFKTLPPPAHEVQPHRRAS